MPPWSFRSFEFIIKHPTLDETASKEEAERFEKDCRRVLKETQALEGLNIKPQLRTRSYLENRQHQRRPMVHYHPLNYKVTIRKTEELNLTQVNETYQQ